MGEGEWGRQVLSRQKAARVLHCHCSEGRLKKSKCSSRHAVALGTRHMKGESICVCGALQRCQSARRNPCERGVNNSLQCVGRALKSGGAPGVPLGGGAHDYSNM